jgi:hypothetical protein
VREGLTGHQAAEREGAALDRESSVELGVASLAAVGANVHV